MTNSHAPAKKSPWRWVKRVLAALGILIFVFIFFVVPYGLSWLLTKAQSRPSDREMVSTPANYDLPFQSVRFHATDGTALAGWWIPVENSPVVLLYGHGLFRSRQETLERAAYFAQRGYAGFLLDFRRHGESAGELCGVGYLERQDVLGAIEFMRDTLGVEQPLITFAVSMGTAAAMLAAAESPEIAGLILDSSFLSFDNLIAHHVKIGLGIPRFPIADEIILFTKWRVGFENEAFDMRHAVEKIGDRPILFLVGSDDVRMPPEISRELCERSPSTHKKVVVVEGASHGAAFRINAPLYEQEVLDFLSSNFGAKHAAASTEPRF